MYFVSQSLLKLGIAVLVGFVAGGAAAQAQVASASSFAGLPASAKSLPEAPAENHALIRAAAPAPSEQALVLPRNFRITPTSGKSKTPGKVAYYLGSTWSIRNFLEAGFIAGVPNITAVPGHQPVAPTGDDPVAQQNYEDAMDAYGKNIDTWRRVNERELRYKAARFEVGFATAETRQLASNLLLPLALHQQARYMPSPVNEDFDARILHAAASIVVTRNDAGNLVPNYSKLGGTVIAAYLGKSLYANAFNAPELNSNHFVMHYIGYSLLGDFATNAAREVFRAAVAPDATMYDLHGRATDDSYYPLSLGGKVMLWVRSTYAPRNFIQAALTGGLPKYTDYPVEPTGNPATWNGYANYDLAYQNYGTTLLGWKQFLEDNLRYHERRFYGGLAASESQQLLQNLVIPIAFDMDPRYVPLGAGYSGSQRLAHAFEGLAVTHTDAGNKTINLPVLGGTIGAAFAAKELYYPQLGTPALATNSVLVKTVGLNLAGDAVYNVIGEFLRHRRY